MHSVAPPWHTCMVDHTRVELKVSLMSCVCARGKVWEQGNGLLNLQNNVVQSWLHTKPMHNCTLFNLKGFSPIVHYTQMHWLRVTTRTVLGG